MEFINSATLIKYNANTRGSNVGDCTTRAISLAFNMDYTKVKKIQNESSKVNRIYPFNNLENCKKVISQLGGGSLIPVKDNITVESFVDSHSGTYIIYCGKYESSERRTHLVCMINDRIYDSWDSRKRFVKGYWEIKNGIKQENLTDIQPILKQKLITDRDFNFYHEYVSNIFNKIIDKNKKLNKIKQESDSDIYFQLEVEKINLKDYTFTLTCETTITFVGGVHIRPQFYPGKIVVTFTPTMSEDDIDEHFNVTFYNKFYSYLYGIILKLEDICESKKVLGPQAGSRSTLRFYDNRSQKSFEALPYWVRALATYFSIDVSRYWGDECREIVLQMKRPHFDLEYDPNKSDDILDFRAENMDRLRKGLDYYKQTGDYNHALEIAGYY